MSLSSLSLAGGLCFFLHGCGRYVCREAQSNSDGGTRDEPDNQDQQHQTKPQNQKTTPTKTTNKPEQTRTKGSGSSPYESKRAKGADPRTNTVVKRGDEFISSRSQWRTSRANLHSGAICVWAGVYSCSGALYVEMPEHTESESEVQFRFGWVHCIKECVRAKNLGSHTVTQNEAVALHHYEAKLQHTHVLARP